MLSVPVSFLDMKYHFRSELVRDGGVLRMVLIRQLVPAKGEEEKKRQVTSFIETKQAMFFYFKLRLDRK
jgi:hypothetical protein